MSKSQPLRILDLSTFTGDTWAIPGTQTPPPDSVRRVVVTGLVRWSIVPMDGTGPGASAVDDLVTLVDARLVLVSEGPSGQALLSRTTSLIECSGEQKLTGAALEDTLSAGQRFVCAVPSLTTGAGSAAALWVMLEAGGYLVG